MGNMSKTQLFVVYDHCKSRNESLIQKASFYEDKGDTYLHCSACHNVKFKNVKALRSNVEWKLSSDDEESADVLVKIDASIIKNPIEFTDSFGHCSLETLMAFYCTNAFRLSHPKIPQAMEDVFVLGELQQFDDWKDDNSPSLRSIQQLS